MGLLEHGRVIVLIHDGHVHVGGGLWRKSVDWVPRSAGWGCEVELAEWHVPRHRHNVIQHGEVREGKDRGSEVTG